jgi:quinol-cytochrome oxidoreductase complex cytochrome b subunit/cytochrome c551/c552
MIGRFVDWVDRQTGLRDLLRVALDEPIPGGASFAYVFGSGLLFLFLSQVVTGVFLALYYVPSADHAHTTVEYVVKEVSSGSFVRSVHVYGSSAIIIVLLLHIAQTILFGSYKGQRHLLWLSGCVLFALMLAMAFTGYLLPWDQKAYFATAVSTNIFVLPVVGPWIKTFVRGGNELGTLTISRFFVAHVFVLPAAIFSFVAMHVYLFRRAGAAGTPVPRQRQSESFYPRQLLIDIAFAAVLVLGLGAFARWIPAELGPEANAADTHFLPRPEWYYVPIFQWLKYWPGSRAIVGIFVIPTIVAVLFAALPFLDRGGERRPWRRPWTIGACAALMIALVTLGVRSREQDRSDPAVARQLDAQRDAVRAFMTQRFEPQESAGSLRVANASLAAVANPLTARGRKVFEEQACDVCHGPDGHGSDSGPSLVGAAARHTEGELSRIIKNPTPKMADSGMQPLDIPDDDLAALTSYVGGLK